MFHIHKLSSNLHKLGHNKKADFMLSPETQFVKSVYYNFAKY